MPEVTIEDLSIHYDVHGKGSPLLLLHGFTCSNSAWDPFVRELHGEYQLIVPDLPGHGRSGIPGEFTHRKAARYMWQLLDSLGVGQILAIGFSSGGMTLLHMATQQPDRVKSMVLWSAAPFLPTQCRETLSRVDPEVITEKDWPWLRDHVGGASQVKWILRQFSSFRDSYQDMNFTPPLLSTIKARTLIIHGDRDEFFPIAIPVTLYEAIPESFLWVFPNATHNFPGDATPEIIQRCRSFFADAWSTKGS